MFQKLYDTLTKFSQVIEDVIVQGHLESLYTAMIAVHFTCVGGYWPADSGFTGGFFLGRLKGGATLENR